MRVSGVVVLLEYPVTLGELAVHVHVNLVVSRFDWRMMLVKVLSQIDLTRTALERFGWG